MKALFIMLTLLVTGAGLTLSITQILKIRSMRDSFASRGDYISSIAGQGAMTLIAFIAAIIIINQILS